MSSQSLKILPMVLTVAVMGYCVWPYLQPPDPPPAALSGPEPIASELLQPSIEPAQERDPFQLAGQSASESHPARRVTRAAAPAGSPAERHEPRAAQDPKGRTIPRDPAGLPGAWKLGATLVGRRRAAVVNGTVYHEGQLIPPPVPDGKALKLARVERDHVVLQDPTRPRFLVLSYGPGGSGVKGAGPVALAAPSGTSSIDIEPILSLTRSLLGADGSRRLEGILKRGTWGAD